MDDTTKLLWFMAWLGLLGTGLGITGYLVVASAFIRESRKRANQDWARAIDEWGRVKNEQEELAREKAKRDREAADAARRDWYRVRDRRGPQGLTRDYRAGFMTEAEVRGTMPASWLAGKTITTECVEPDCVYVDIPHTDADHAFCEDDDCTKFASQHTIADHVAKTPQDLDDQLAAEKCWDSDCAMAHHPHTLGDHSALRPEEGT